MLLTGKSLFGNFDKIIIRQAVLLYCSVFLAAVFFMPGCGIGAADADDLSEIKIGFILEIKNKKYTLSRIDYPEKDDGIAGAEVAIVDNNTTGRFTKQKYLLKSKRIGKNADPVETAQKMVDEGFEFILLDLPAEMQLKVSDAFKGKDVMFFNVSAKDNALRRDKCRANIIHIAPSRAMLADAIVQYLVVKKWPRMLLLRGKFPADIEYADSLKRAAKRFGAKVVEEREYAYDPGAARTDGGSELIKKQMLAFTQEAKDHDVVAVADESEVFGAYVPYRTWVPRPVVGTAGLSPLTFHIAHEQWGASQFQNRFYKKARRYLKPVDYNAFIAVRSIGEAATRTKSNDPAKMIGYLKDPEFSIPGFKGQKLTIRDWNLQMRMPIMLTDRYLAISWSPQEGFLHQRNLTDSLGFDKPEANCSLN